MCGICGIAGVDHAAQLTYLGLYALQHRGQESAGIAVVDQAGPRPPHRGTGLEQEVFSPDALSGLAGPAATVLQRRRAPARLFVCVAHSHTVL